MMGTEFYNHFQHQRSSSSPNNQGGTTAEVFEFLAATSQAADVERVAFVMDNAPCYRRAAQADIG